MRSFSRCLIHRYYATLLLIALLFCKGCGTLPSQTLPDADRAADAWVAVGMAHLEQQDISRARQAFERAQHFDKERVGAWHGLALCAQLERDIPEAERLYQHAFDAASRSVYRGQANENEQAALLNNHARLLYDKGALDKACTEHARALHYRHRATAMPTLAGCPII